MPGLYSRLASQEMLAAAHTNSMWQLCAGCVGPTSKVQHCHIVCVGKKAVFRTQGVRERLGTVIGTVNPSGPICRIANIPRLIA